ncbi:MAG: flagellar protein [Melioribacteraceae bacterium]|nr:flagellar protein [Melioribacteraceae bacterium]MCF8353727.1 flagellar protein [Melioribacteraceae bacterium]MCF8392464.1 flagellar protein [Melioribacteraceae bacterium]MCF8418375.1 flagellar protein [Melioribacteraceae bacterium]
MAEMINGIKVPFVPVVNNTPSQKSVEKSSYSEFDSIFKHELEKLKFSSHASKRMETRNINLSESDMSRLQNAIEKAGTKGSRDSLIMMGDNAFVVSVDNRTVITAVQMNETNDKVFTNIDSVVFAQ